MVKQVLLATQELMARLDTGVCQVSPEDKDQMELPANLASKDQLVDLVTSENKEFEEDQVLMVFLGNQV